MVGNTNQTVSSSLPNSQKHKVNIIKALSLKTLALGRQVKNLSYQKFLAPSARRIFWTRAGQKLKWKLNMHEILHIIPFLGNISFATTCIQKSHLCILFITLLECSLSNPGFVNLYNTVITVLSNVRRLGNVTPIICNYMTVV